MISVVAVARRGANSRRPRTRPTARLELDQTHCTVETKLRRVLALYEADALEGRRILLLGDDDLVSLAIRAVVQRLARARLCAHLVVARRRLAAARLPAGGARGCAVSGDVLGARPARAAPRRDSPGCSTPSSPIRRTRSRPPRSSFRVPPRRSTAPAASSSHSDPRSPRRRSSCSARSARWASRPLADPTSTTTSAPARWAERATSTTSRRRPDLRPLVTGTFEGPIYTASVSS